MLIENVRDHTVHKLSISVAKVPLYTQGIINHLSVKLFDWNQSVSHIYK